MIPTQSSSDTNGCNNISSNCVIWQGPDIACIDLCTGDTVSEVVAKLAEKLCDIISGVQSEPDLSGFDLKCALPSGTAPSTLKDNLQAIVDYICALPSGGGGGGAAPTNINLCTNLQYNDPATGAVVTSLPIEQYSLLVGNKVCDILDSITTINNTLTSLGDRITILENCVLPCSTGSVNEAQIISQCVVPGGQLVNVSVVLLALETRFCALETATGTPTLINNAISQQSLTSSYTLLSNPSTNYGSQTGWHTSTTTLAQSVQNQWIVLDDLYHAIQTIQLNCCPGACDSITVGMAATGVIDPGTGNMAQVNLNFSTSSIPSAFNDCGGFQTITITDTVGGSITTTQQVTALQSNTSGVNVTVSSLNTYGDLSVAMNWCFNDGTNNCEGTINQTVAGEIACPPMTTNNETTNGFDVSFSHNFGTSAIFTIGAYEYNNTTGSTNSTAAEEHTLTNQASGVSQTFSSLTANTSYKIRLSISIGGQTKVCPDVQFATAEGAPPCDSGMDVFYLFDYTGSMGGDIETAKTAASNLISTIQTEVGSNDYRLGLALADEYHTYTGNRLSSNPETGDAPYFDATEYQALPVGQRLVIKNQVDSGKKQYYTVMEPLGTDNNGTQWTTALDKINCGTGVGDSGIACDVGGVETNLTLGSGADTPEPTVPLARRLINQTSLSGGFRTNVAKYIIIFTDAASSYENQTTSQGTQGWDPVSYQELQTLQTEANAAGIKIIVMGTGVIQGYTPTGGSEVFPWQQLALQTGGTFTSNFTASDVISAIQNGCGGTPT